MDPALEPGEVHVWRVRADGADPRAPRWWRWLDAAERERAAAIRADQDVATFVAGRGLLRWRLARTLGVEPSALAFRPNAHGKPLLVPRDGSARSLPEIGFNVTHSGECVLVALAPGCRVGVDVESPRGIRSPEAVARRYFSPAENEALERLDAEERAQAFRRCWTRKEAYAKAVGLGLQVSLSSFDVSIEADDVRLLAIRDEVESAREWRLSDLRPAPRYVGALAVDASGLIERCFDADG